MKYFLRILIVRVRHVMAVFQVGLRRYGEAIKAVYVDGVGGSADAAVPFPLVDTAAAAAAAAAAESSHNSTGGSWRASHNSTGGASLPVDGLQVSHATSS